MIEENHNSMLLTSFDWIIIVDYTSTVDHIHFLDQHYHIIIEWFRDNRDKRISYKRGLTSVLYLVSQDLNSFLQLLYVNYVFYLQELHYKYVSNKEYDQ